MCGFCLSIWCNIILPIRNNTFPLSITEIAFTPLLIPSLLLSPFILSVLTLGQACGNATLSSSPAVAAAAFSPPATPVTTMPMYPSPTAPNPPRRSGPGPALGLVGVRQRQRRSGWGLFQLNSPNLTVHPGAYLSLWPPDPPPNAVRPITWLHGSQKRSRTLSSLEAT